MSNANSIPRHPRASLSRVIKLLLSSSVYALDEFRRLLIKITGQKPNGSCVVLYYHSVPADQRALFGTQLDTIQRLARVVDVTCNVQLEAGVRQIGITFDDAFENFVTEALPELLQRKFPATMFVIADALGKAFGPAASPEKVMSVAQLLALPADFVSIGSHTQTHPYMPELDDANALRELRDSKLSLERIMGREIATFSFPFGGFTQRLIELAREAGYQRVFTTVPEFAFAPGATEFAVGRVRVDPTDWPSEFRLKIAGAYRWLPLAIAAKRRIFALGKGASSDANRAAPRSAIRELSTG